MLVHGGYTVDARSDAEGDFDLEWPAGYAAELAVMHAALVDHLAAAVDLEEDGRVFLERSARLIGHIAPWPPPGLEESASPEALLWSHDRRKRPEEGHRTSGIDGNGRFLFHDLSPGAWNVAVCVPGSLVDVEGGVEIDPGEERELHLQARRGGTLRARVTRRGSGQVVAGVEVSARSQRITLPPGSEGAFERSAQTNDRGEVELTGLAPGNHRLRLGLPWGGDENASITVPETLGVIEETFEVAPPARLSGHVLDAEGKPLDGARVVLLPRGERAALERAFKRDGRIDRPGAVTADGGAFLIEGVEAEERLTLLAFPPGGVQEGPPGSVTVGPVEPEGVEADVVVRLPAGAPLSGRVLADDGLPVSAAEVTLLAVHKSASAPFRSTVADAEGFFRFDAIPVGAAVVEAKAHGFRPRRKRVDVGPAGVEDVVVELAASFLVEGRVVDERGAGRSGVQVRLQIDEGTPEAQALADAGGKGMKYLDFTDGYGRFRFDRLTRGRWVPSVRPADWELGHADPTKLILPGDTALVLELRRLPRPELTVITGEVWALDGGELNDLRIRGLGRGAVLSTDGGRFEVRGMEPGQRRFDFEADGYVPERIGPIELSPGATTDLGRVQLTPGTRVTVRVQGAKGKGLDKARVMLRPIDPSHGGTTVGARTWRFVKTGKGTYRVEAVPRAKWRLKITHGGYKTHNEVVEVVEQSSQELLIRLVPKGTPGDG